MSKHKGFPLSKKDRDYFEQYIREHEPYPEGAPELDFDANKVMAVDSDRSIANMFQSILELDDKIRAEQKE